jgi:hypothetical protein
MEDTPRLPNLNLIVIRQHKFILNRQTNSPYECLFYQMQIEDKFLDVVCKSRYDRCECIVNDKK